MAKRKVISKKLRFEVFKRDGFQCAYCGKSPPTVMLEIDHIDPVSKGGKCDINNYLTACFDCNRGKTNITLDKIPSKVSENLEILKIQEEQIAEYRKFIKKIDRRLKKDIGDISAIYTDVFKDYQLSTHFKNGSVKQFLRKLPKHEVVEAMEIAVGKISDSSKAINYFCGICWTKINNKDDRC